MKKLLLAFFCIIFFTATAQDKKQESSTGYKSILKFSPLKFLFSTFQLGYEMSDGKSGSFVINAGVSYQDNNSRYKEGYIGEFQYRIYPLRTETSAENTMHYLYLGPYLSFKHYVIEDYNYYYDPYDPYNNGTYTQRDVFNAYNFGVLTGFNFVIAKRFHIDYFIGGGLRTSDSNYNDGSIIEEGYKGIAPRVGFELGVNF
jgi:hypothetical protein